MFYSLKHENKIEQGDICNNLPKFIPSKLISEEGTDHVWKNYINSLEKGETPAVKFSILPSPTWGVALTQTCDIENAKKGDSILFAELINYDNYQDINQLSNKKKKKYIDKILDAIRNKPRTHYFPELTINEHERYGPWSLDFSTIFFVPMDLIKDNIDLFWKARLINPAKEVLKEKISRFFTRLAFEECIFFSSDEITYYIKYRNRDKEKIMRIRSDLGFIDK
ncbi:MAG: hypothetical protein ACTSYB_12175 [Candidatus Helarchaeota archaeon]